MEETRIQVDFGSEVYGSFVLNKIRGKKIYKNKKTADRYIKEWLAKKNNNICRCFDLAKKEWFTWNQI